MSPTNRIKPNQACPCGSGKKYKKCCSNRNAECAQEGNANPLQEFLLDDALGHLKEDELDELLRIKERHDPSEAEMFQEILRRGMARKCILGEYLTLMSQVLQISEETVKKRVKDGDASIVDLFEQCVFKNARFITLLNVSSEAEYFAKLKAADRSLVMHLRRSTARGEVEVQRMLVHDGGRLEAYTNALDEELRHFFSNHGGVVHPAVDLATGVGVLPLAYAQRYRQSMFDAALEWYPTEWRGNPEGKWNPLDFLRKSLLFLAEENGELNSGTLLFADPNNMAVYSNDRIILKGLKKNEFNGLEGIALRHDPHCEGRIAVLLDGRKKPISFKTSNLLFVETKTRAGISYEKAVERETSRTIISGLMERSCELDIQQRDTWSYLTSKLRGRCAVVTCTKLLSCCGYRAPHIWKDTLELASALLAPGGLFLQHDDTVGGFGEVGTMEQHAGLVDLELVCRKPMENVVYDLNIGELCVSESGQPWYLVLWRKKNVRAQRNAPEESE